MPKPSPFSFDLGKSLQLLQSVLLILTFFWAFYERKRYRVADRFSKIGLEFVAEALDQFYDDMRAELEELRKKLQSQELTEDTKIKAQSFFTGKFFYTRTVVLHRIACFPEIETEVIDAIFSEMEDAFPTELAALAPDSRHPESLAATISKGSAKIIRILMEHEIQLSGHDSWRDRFKKRRRPKARPNIAP